MQNTAKRKGGPRSRTGCSKCRQRRIKCDETRPSCTRCLRGGLVCPGYITSRDTPEIRGSALATAAAADSTIKSYAIPFQVPGSQTERQLLHYFCVEAAADLSGFLVSDFWTRTVLRRSQDEIAVRQAVVAISSLHRQHRACDQSPGTNGSLAPEGSGGFAEASVVYNKALRSLRKYIRNTKDDVDRGHRATLVVPLICCALFYSYESVQGNIDAALQHLAAGRAMLNAEQAKVFICRSPGGEDAADLAMLARMFARLEVQVAIFDEARYAHLISSSKTDHGPNAGVAGATVGTVKHHENLLSDADDDEYSLEHAQQHLTQLQSCVLQFLGSNIAHKDLPEASLPLDVVDGKARLQEAFVEWGMRFVDLLAAHGHGKVPRPRVPQSWLPDTHFAYNRDNNEANHGSYNCSRTGSFDPADLAGVVRSAVASDPGLGVVYVHYYMFYLILTSSLPEDTGAYSRVAPSNSHQDPTAAVQYHPSPQNPVEIILDIAEMIVYNSGTNNSSLNGSVNTERKRSISSETGIVAPLFLMIVRCADIATVRRAVGVLEASVRREGLYDSHVVAAVANSALAQQPRWRQGAFLEDGGSWGKEAGDNYHGDAHDYSERCVDARNLVKSETGEAGVSGLSMLTEACLHKTGRLAGPMWELWMKARGY
ncbi:RNA polymerase II-specific transcription factor-like protein [Microdochium nivale]|nr:RNA polymerase II-specific transcription factor-like protein [Microdochium nivale]